MRKAFSVLQIVSPRQILHAKNKRADEIDCRNRDDEPHVVGEKRAERGACRESDQERKCDWQMARASQKTGQRQKYSFNGLH